MLGLSSSKLSNHEVSIYRLCIFSGLQHIYDILKQGPFDLMITLSDGEGFVLAFYRVTMGNSTVNYQMTTTDYTGEAG